jgi:hypothetical protein
MSNRTWFSEQLWHKKTDAEDAAQADIFRAAADERLTANDPDDEDVTLTLDMDGWAQWQAMIDADIEKGWAEHDKAERGDVV